ncbi:MAG: hemolysin III family protein [Erysipelotrichaceae bacterium]|nr:hemolysin III family protein [Erysipelotrichaceae bacterium]MDY5251373.1 hemolysin III family protein [Erysipelotrichaceae bacterium]
MYKWFKNARDPISSYTHFLGVVFGALFLLLALGKGFIVGSKGLWILGTSIFALTIMMLYGASSYYHYLPKNHDKLTFYRKLDHSMIYVLIAGSYTPVCLRFFALRHALIFLGIIWAIAILGIAVKILWLNSPRIFYTLLYLIMGWAVIFDFKSFLVMPSNCLLLITIGGIAYTIGGIIYIIKQPNINNAWGFHELFHIFILIGTIFQAMACFIYMV